MTKTKKAILITLIVLVMITAIIVGILSYVFINGERPITEYIPYADLRKVMADDIVYLSEDFFSVNKLIMEALPIISPPPGVVVERKDNVEIWYYSYKLRSKPDFSSRVKNLSGCYYILENTLDSENIPIRIYASFSTEKIKGIKYDREYGGYKYAVKNSQYDNYASYYIKTQPKKGATCIVRLSFSISEENSKQYTDEQIHSRMEELFKSAVDNIVMY